MKLLTLLASVMMLQPINLYTDNSTPFNNGKDAYVSSGVYENGKFQYSLQEATSGGSIADPSKGSSFRLNLYENGRSSQNDKIAEGQSDSFTTIPLRPTESAKVSVSGFKNKGKEYTKPGEYVDLIIVNGINIELNQGKYENKNPEVSAVEFISFSIKTNDKSEIHILITMKNGTRIDIVYNDVISYDGQC